jgi:hypothetical protein
VHPGRGEPAAGTSHRRRQRPRQDLHLVSHPLDSLDLDSSQMREQDTQTMIFAPGTCSSVTTRLRISIHHKMWARSRFSPLKSLQPRTSGLEVRCSRIGLVLPLSVYAVSYATPPFPIPGCVASCRTVPRHTSNHRATTRQPQRRLAGMVRSFACVDRWPRPPCCAQEPSLGPIGRPRYRLTFGVPNVRLEITSDGRTRSPCGLLG